MTVSFIGLYSRVCNSRRSSLICEEDSRFFDDTFLRISPRVIGGRQGELDTDELTITWTSSKTSSSESVSSDKKPTSQIKNPESSLLGHTAWGSTAGARFVSLDQRDRLTPCVENKVFMQYVFIEIVVNKHCGPLEASNRSCFPEDKAPSEPHETVISNPCKGHC